MIPSRPGKENYRQPGVLSFKTSSTEISSKQSFWTGSINKHKTLIKSSNVMNTEKKNNIPTCSILFWNICIRVMYPPRGASSHVPTSEQLSYWKLVKTVRRNIQVYQMVHTHVSVLLHASGPRKLKLKRQHDSRVKERLFRLNRVTTREVQNDFKNKTFAHKLTQCLVDAHFYHHRFTDQGLVKKLSF